MVRALVSSPRLTYNSDMSQISSLYRLQQIDSALDRAANRLHEIETILAGSEILKEAEIRFNEANQTLERQNRELRQAEIRVSGQRIKIEQCESNLYGGRIQNPKELQDLQKEVVSLKKYLAVLEDQQIESMMAAEEAESTAAEASQNLEMVRGQVIEANSRLIAEQSALVQDKARLSLERQAAEQAIPTENLNLYQQLRTSRRGVAVAAIRDRSCTACGANLTPAVVQSASNQLTRCSSCGRLLYNG